MSQKSLNSFFAASPSKHKKRAADDDGEQQDAEKKTKTDTENDEKTSSSASSSSLSSSSSSGDSIAPLDPPSEADGEKYGYAQLEELIPPVWRKLLKEEFSKPYWATLKKSLIDEEKSKAEIFPPKHLIFNALWHCPSPASIKAVIVGQDPYHAPGQAEGLCFSVPKGIAVPSSLKNIYKELASDITGFKVPNHGHLLDWANQGIFLLNTVLTVTRANPNSHQKFGWMPFTDAILQIVNKYGGGPEGGVVFLLWGTPAQKKAKSISATRHHLLKTVHPSGLSANKGFFGCKHFSQCNELLKKQGKDPIKWQV